MPAPARRRAWRTHLGVLGLFTLLAIILTWPLALHLTTHVPGVPQWAFDESTFIWNIWYFKHALIDSLRTPLHSELIWYPLGIDLVLYTYNFYHVLAAMPLALAFNLPLASNLTLWASTILSGYGTFLLLMDEFRRRTREPAAEARLGTFGRSTQVLAAFAGGALYAFASNRAVYAALGHYDMVTTQWIPFYALMLLRVLDEGISPQARRRAAVLAGLFFAFTGLAEMISAMFLGVFTLIVLLTRLFRRGEGTRSRSVVLREGLVNFALLAVVAFVVWSPALIPILLAFRTSNFDLKGWGDAFMLSTDLFGWFTPTVFHPLLGGDVVKELHLVQQRAANPDLPGFRDINTVFLGWVSLALAVVGAFAFRRKVTAWIWTAVLFGLFTLGPLLQINGRSQFDLDGLQTTVPLPFLVLHFLPVIKANRAPNRNSVLLMLGLAVLAGYGVWWLLERLRQWQVRRGRGAADAQHRTEPAPMLSMGAAASLHVRESGDVSVHGEAQGRSQAEARMWPVGVTVVGCALVGLILFEHLAAPIALSDARIPAVYSQIAADPRPGAVMQLPLGWRNSFGVFGPEQTLLQYYQSAHGRPMLGGNISRAPDFKLDYFKRLPYFQALTEIEFGRPVAPELLAAAKAQAAELAYLYDLRYLILTPPIPDRLPYADTWQAAWAFAKDSLPLEDKPFWSQDGIEAYRVRQPQGSTSFRLDLGGAGTFPYRGEGWDTTEAGTIYDTGAIWATDKESRTFMPLRQIDPAATYPVTVRAHPFAYPGSPQQTVALAVNGHALEAQPLPDGWQEVTWQVPGALLVNGLNHIDLRWGYAAAPRTVTPGSRQIGSTGATLPVDADVKAFADGGFIALFDEEGAQSDASAGRRGVNVTVLDPKTGAVRDKVGFDTTANEGESRKLAAFLKEIKPGSPVIVASYGDAWAHLTQEAVDGLRALGADVSKKGLQNRYFAIVGAAGAQPGMAVQSVDPKEAFVRVSLNRDRRTLSGAVDWVQVGK